MELNGSCSWAVCWVTCCCCFSFAGCGEMRGGRDFRGTWWAMGGQSMFFSLGLATWSL
ncbi:hypothetical protein BDU57DRAFT_516738 [Ampelomyces quisqualis]|uniref:Uncharacterized protein n=1 Tax=Ampelomyces quisqualis TaxID=50730 RepID=A0A6A5QRE8_AMPQU|nr:hypothetical protein BDU57DRAFT_516738 [Ampelomyces quisqualis]